MRSAIFALLAILLSTELVNAASSTKYFLTPQRLRRLKRDRDRQTPRWVSFENRINTVPDSPERGLELALYYAITGDEARGREAIRLEKTSPCRKRESALIRNWIGHELYARDSTPTPLAECVTVGSGTAIPTLRDSLLLTLQAGNEPDPASASQLVKALENGAYKRGSDLYAAVEFLTLWQAATRTDAREQSSKFFASLPTLLLLSMKPSTVENPDWQTHVASLALVSLDPNSSGAQFLQGWAIEDRQMLREGPGLLYELLWADPYLPGVGYQNLDPWMFDDAAGSLFARSDWSPQSCWIHVFPGSSEERNCPANWSGQTVHFGHLNLVPFSGKCIDVTRPASQSTILSKLPPGQKLKYDDGGDKAQVSATGSSGLWRVPVNVQGKVCLAR